MLLDVEAGARVGGRPDMPGRGVESEAGWEETVGGNPFASVGTTPGSAVASPVPLPPTAGSTLPSGARLALLGRRPGEDFEGPAAAEAAAACRRAVRGRLRLDVVELSRTGNGESDGCRRDGEGRGGAKEREDVEGATGPSAGTASSAVGSSTSGSAASVAVAV